MAKRLVCVLEFMAQYVTRVLNTGERCKVDYPGSNNSENRKKAVVVKLMFHTSLFQRDNKSNENSNHSARTVLTSDVCAT